MYFQEIDDSKKDRERRLDSEEISEDMYVKQGIFAVMN
jgi:hypothetical protein